MGWLSFAFTLVLKLLDWWLAGGLSPQEREKREAQNEFDEALAKRDFGTIGRMLGDASRRVRDKKDSGN